jgi:hypothetical protein
VIQNDLRFRKLMIAVCDERCVNAPLGKMRIVYITVNY